MNIDAIVLYCLYFWTNAEYLNIEYTPVCMIFDTDLYSKSLRLYPLESWTPDSFHTLRIWSSSYAKTKGDETWRSQSFS